MTTVSVVVSFIDAGEVASPYLARRIDVGKEHRQHGARSKQILDLERVLIRVMCRLVVVEHEVNCVCGSSDEHDLEDGVIEVSDLVEGPQEIEVARDVHQEVQELRLEGYPSRALDGESVRHANCASPIERSRLWSSSYAAE